DNDGFQLLSGFLCGDAELLEFLLEFTDAVDEVLHFGAVRVKIQIKELVNTTPQDTKASVETVNLRRSGPTERHSTLLRAFTSSSNLIKHISNSQSVLNAAGDAGGHAGADSVFPVFFNGGCSEASRCTTCYAFTHSVEHRLKPVFV